MIFFVSKNKQSEKFEYEPKKSQTYPKIAIKAFKHSNSCAILVWDFSMHSNRKNAKNKIKYKPEKIQMENTQKSTARHKQKPENKQITTKLAFPHFIPSTMPERTVCVVCEYIKPE